MFVFCVVSNDKRQNAVESRQRTRYGWSTQRVQENTKKHFAEGMDVYSCVCCVGGGLCVCF